MTDPVSTNGLTVARPLYDFVTDEALPGTGLDAEEFWAGLAALIAELSPRNRELLAERDRLQNLVDGWHQDHPGPPDLPTYRQFLTSIGYLVSEPEPFTIGTGEVDPELSSIAGPQLVVPVLNSRFALNAANARWGSLYDALYGTDAIPGPAGGKDPGHYDSDRGRQVIDFARRFLDQWFPLTRGGHGNSTRYFVTPDGLLVELGNGHPASLSQPEQLRGYTGEPDQPSRLLLLHHGLHVEVQIDRDDPVGATDPAGIKDLVIESALTTIVDFEDSVAAVDADDKVVAYRTWLGLNRGDLTAEVTKNGTTTTRRLAPDRTYTTPDGGTLTLRGRAVLLVRNVGHLMTTDAVLDSSGKETPEGILDAVLTGLTALPGLNADNPRRNSRSDSIYIVKPKMHGPDEVRFADELFRATEDLLKLAPGTIKMGVMDEERRTSVNLRAAIRAAASRIVFVNTGFLDRTGDEIHTGMGAGPMVRKADMKTQPWIGAYEESNVDAALAAGFSGRAQIGKGMWAMPDLMAAMLDQKGAQPKAGASTAWVPSPTAATLHALHYHQVDVFERQREIVAQPRTNLDALLTVPVGDGSWTAEERQEELDNNVQSILGYVVRWVDQGVGCSKVPDLHHVALMEDRATLRISSQLLANWLRHHIITAEQVKESLLRMAAFVDQQNADDPTYQAMTADPESSSALQAATQLIFSGTDAPSGYTEPVLHRSRRQRKWELDATSPRPAD